VKKKRKKVAKKRKPRREGATLDALRMVYEGIHDVVPVASMQAEQVVPTMLTSYNRATGVGGHPLGCITLIHGPEQVGKSVLALAIAESLRRAGHPAMVFDTEFAGEREWYSAITPESGYKRVGDLDEVIANVNRMIDNLAKAKAKKLVPEDVGCVFVVDSLTKLLPRSLLEKIESEGVEKQYPLQAQWVSLWSKALVPLLYRSNSSMIIVLQERAALDATRPGQKQYKVTLGKSVQYDNRLRIRVEYAKKVKRGERVVGMECHYRIWNNKLTGTTFEEGVFYTSNGKGDVPKGLDLVREAVEEALLRKLLRSRKRRKIDYMMIEVDGETTFEVRGGKSDVRELLSSDPEEFERFVGILNRRE